MSKVFLYILPFVFLALIATCVVYASRRLGWAFAISPKLLMVIFGITVLAFLISIVVIMQTNPTSTISHIINNISTIGAGVMMLLVLALLAVDLVNLGLNLNPKTFGIATIALTSILSIYSLWNAQHIRTYNQDIIVQNLEQPVRIAQLSDIHIGHYWGKGTIERLASIVEKENVDAVVITGDLFDGRVKLSTEILAPFKRLTMPIYFVEGNHDGYSGADEIKAILRANDIKVLDIQKEELMGLQIVGLNYLLADKNTANTFHAPLTSTTMEEALPTMGIDRNRASILLHHNPVGVEYAAANGINLYLAGHTHGGQIFPATIIAKWMFYYNKGLYKYNDNTQVYVSQGSGTFGPPMRLGTHSEVTILNLKDNSK